MVHKSLSQTLGQSFEHITLYTYNGAAIFWGGHPYIWSTTVLHNTHDTIYTGLQIYSVVVYNSVAMY